MRISNYVLTNMVNGSMGSSYETYVKTIQKIVNNKNFTKMSENPTDGQKVLKLNDQLSQLNVYQSNIDAATNEMNFTYDTLGNISDEISTINSLIIGAANATTTPDSAKAIASEIKERVATIQDKLNSKYMDNYIFSGTFTSTKPFQEMIPEAQENETEVDLGELEGSEETGDTGETGDTEVATKPVITYVGSSDNAGHRKLTISEDTQFTYNITGASLFGKEDYYFTDEDGTKQKVTSDFFSQMSELDDLLNADSLDFAKIREKLQVTSNALTKITRAQGNVSAQVSKLNTTKNLNESTILNLTDNKAGIEEVDIVKAASDLASAQTAMQASYALGTRVLSNVSLLDYI